MLALCTYAIEKCSIREILDVSANHQLTLVRGAGRWDVLQNVTRIKAEQALKESDARFHSLFDNMAEGYALHEIITDEEGVPCDYRFLDMNPAFERLTGLQRSAVRGKRVTEVLPGPRPTGLKDTACGPDRPASPFRKPCSRLAALVSGLRLPDRARPIRRRFLGYHRTQIAR